MAMGIIKDSELAGKHVILEDASDVGTVGDIYVDVYDWHITKFDLVVDKRYIERLEVDKKMIRRTTLPIKTHLVRAVGDVVHLNGSVEELRRSTRAVQPHETAKEAHAASAAKKEKVEEPKRYQHRDHDDEKPSKL
jgi:sporulation protein YlmC with PRC-barrel domain